MAPPSTTYGYERTSDILSLSIQNIDFAPPIVQHGGLGKDKSAGLGYDRWERLILTTFETLPVGYVSFDFLPELSY